LSFSQENKGDATVAFGLDWKKIRSACIT